MKYLNCRVCEMTLNVAAELEKGVFFGWCSKCQTTTEVQAAPEPTPITQVDPAWQKAMDDLTDEKAMLALMLHNIVSAWETRDGTVDCTEEWWDTMVAAATRGRFALDNLDKPEK